MSFEALDNKAKEAAGQFHPPYNQDAWKKMETLLDAQLPRADEPKKRRALFWLLPIVLLVGGAAWLIEARPWKSRPGTTVADAGTKAVPTILPPPETNTAAPAAGTESSGAITENQDIPKKSVAAGTEAAASTTDSHNVPPNRVTTVDGTLPSTQRQQVVTVQPQLVAAKDPVQPTFTGLNKSRLGLKAVSAKKRNGKNRTSGTEQSSAVTGPVLGEEKEVPAQDSKAPDAQALLVQDQSAVQQSGIAQPITAGTGISADQKTITPAINTVSSTKPATAAKKKKAGGKWQISFSAGADVSQVSAGRTGTYKTLFGAGIGYSLSPRLLLRTGIYQTDKIYSANPEDYHAYISYPLPGYNLVDIAAECRVIQIPVTVSFVQPLGRKSNILASAGFASVWMKREKYDYNYQSTYGNYYKKYSYEISNQNRHLFSMLSVSAGYERRINSTFSILAEPYIHLPVSGIGLGHVKLKSAGILLSVSARPFAKK